MKKFFALILAVVMMLSVAAFAEEADTTATVMTHEEFVAAELESEVTVETYVQDKQSWWDNKATFYCQSEDGAYFIYEMPCTEDEYAQLVPGTKIRVTGYKAEWSGEVEITDATFEILEADPYIAEATDVTELLGTDELINHQNEKVAFTGLTVEAYDESGAAFAYKNDAEKTDDLYFKASYNGQTYDFCVEFYLRGQDTDVYKAVEALNVGDTIDVEGFLYWYEGANPHVTSVTVK
ncbi:MAG: acid shock protein [Eubacteriales bacterium]|nr:acid shock protein [Eubacteriales bacterium]MDY2602511.1 acid shock protein [Eubacteriales bacterium]